MRCNINSDNKNKMIETGIAFCSETGKRLDNVRYNPRDLVRSSACKNTWAVAYAPKSSVRLLCGNPNLWNLI